MHCNLTNVLFKHFNKPNKSVLSFVHMTLLPTFAAVAPCFGAHASGRPAPNAVDRYLFLHSAQQQTRHMLLLWSNDGTDRWTFDSFVDPAVHTLRSVPTNRLTILCCHLQKYTNCFV